MAAIQLTGIGKRYILECRDRLSLKDSFLSLCRGISQRKEFWALKDVNLEVPKGQALGIIGRNGSGKTTLLEILGGITKPTTGLVKVSGKVSALLELGAGFQDELTGRENIYLNGLILGMSRKEIQRSQDSIIDFSDIGSFIDAPVRTYSAGMYLRLGFAIATQLNPDTLLIDEVLAIGDLGFQNRCLKKIDIFREQGKTVIIVSHNLNMIRQLCGRAILIDKGNIICDGQPQTVINRHLSLFGNEQRGSPTGEIEITNVYFKNNKGEIVNSFVTGETMTITVEYFAHRRVENPVFGIGIYRDSVYLIGPNTRDSGYRIDYVEDKGALAYTIRSIPFVKGQYKVSVSAHDIAERNFYDYRERISEFYIIPGQRDIKHGLFDAGGEWGLRSN